MNNKANTNRGEYTIVSLAALMIVGPVRHLRFTDLGLERGKSAASHENMTKVVAEVESLLSE